MILVDTSVWVAHFKSANRMLVELLEDNEVAIHNFIIGELACGQLKNRQEILGLLKTLPEVLPVTHEEALYFVDSYKLYGVGIGWVDSHLLASVIAGGFSLWTNDRSLSKIASKLEVSFS